MDRRLRLLLAVLAVAVVMGLVIGVGFVLFLDAAMKDAFSALPRAPILPA